MPPAPFSASAPLPPPPDLARRAYAVVLAGGRGSRLGPLTAHRAKPALPFGGKLAIIDFALSNCVNSGIRRIAVLTQYKAQSLIRHVERGWNFLELSLGEFVDLVPAQQQVDTQWYCGTANAVFQNLHMLREARPRHVLVLAGDHAYKMDYSLMLRDHVRAGLPASVACIEVPLAEACDFGVLQTGPGDRVCAFDEKPCRPAPLPGRPGLASVSMGIYAFDTEFLIQQLERDAADPESTHDFGHDLLPRLAAAGQLHAHRYALSSVQPAGAAPYWRDVGTIDAYYEANMDLIRPTPALDLYDEDWPILSLQRQLPPSKFVFDDEGRRGCAVDTLVASGCVVRGASVRRSILFSKVELGEGSLVEDSLLLPGVVVGRDVRLRHAIVDKRCVLPDGLRAGWDERTDAQRFHVSPGGVVLITPEMLAGASGVRAQAGEGAADSPAAWACSSA
jgi:glucose-1-phosphate adenylyltransferase